MTKKAAFSTIAQALSWAQPVLKASGVEDARFEAEYLLSCALGCKRHELFLNSGKALSPGEAAAFSDYIARRSKRVPAQYIVGHTDFRGLTIKVTRDTLIPRPETEILVDEAVKKARTLPHTASAGVVAIDLCTGSGCVAVSFSHEVPSSATYATDISKEALKVAADNARHCGVADRIHFCQGDLYSALDGLGLSNRASIIISNPPYVAQAEMDGLQPEVRDYEPHAALLGGADGLDFYRRIIKDAPRYLTPGGFLLMEIGYGQAAKIKNIFDEYGGFTDIEVKKDLSGIERVMMAKKRQ